MKYLLTILMAVMLSAICNSLSAQEKSIEVSVDIETVNGKEQRNFKVTIGDGNSEKEIAWKDNGEIPTEIKEELVREGVDIKMLESDGEVEVTVEEGGDQKINKEIEIIKIHSEESNGHHIQDREIRIDDNGGDIRILKLKEGEELPDDVQKILDENDIDLNQLIEEGIQESHENGLKVVKKKVVKIKTKDDDGKETIMEWNGEGDAPDEILKLLEEEGIEMEGDGDHKMIFINKGGDGKNINLSKETKKQYRIKTIDNQGNEKVIKWNGEGEMPEEMKEHKDMINDAEIRVKKGSGNKAQLGVMVEENDGGKGVKVIDVVDGSPAARVGFAEGYYITAINDEKVNSIDQLLKVLKPFKPGETINIKFINDTKDGDVDITLGGARSDSNIFIFKDAINGEDFDMLKKVEKCDENTTVTTIKVEKHKELEAAAATQTKRRSIPADRQLSLKSFAAYPNPTNNSVNISFTGDNDPTVVQLTDITGKEIFKEVLDSFDGSYSKDVDLSNYAKGQYILYVIQNQKIFTESIILQ